MSDSLTLRAAISEFLMTMECAAYSPKTTAYYRRALDALADFAETRGVCTLSDLTPNVVRGAMGAAMQRPRARARIWKDGKEMANIILASAKAMTRHFRNDGFLNVPDLVVVKAIKQPERIQPRLSGPEFHALEQALGRRLLSDSVPAFLVARDWSIVQVLAETGLRAAELCSLNVADVNFDEGSILVRRGKGGKDRAINVVDDDEPAGGAALGALAEYLVHRQPLSRLVGTEALFLSRRGNRLSGNAVRGVLRTLCVEAGIDGNRPPHAFRRGHFTTAYQNDPSSLPVLVSRMGWTTDLMARVYTRGSNIDLARTQHRPSVGKIWREAASAPRSRPAPVQRQDSTVQELLERAAADPSLRQALLHALLSSNVPALHSGVHDSR